jgi:hypothetical protein
VSILRRAPIGAEIRGSSEDNSIVYVCVAVGEERSYSIVHIHDGEDEADHLP